MPLKKIVLARDPQPVPEQEEIEERAELQAFEPTEAEAIQPGRPHQAFVESQLRQYLHDNNIRSLVKPTREEIRAAAMPILCQARRRRKRWTPLDMADRAVNAMQLHALKQGWIKPSYSRLGEYAGYIDVLIQLARDADWLAPEIPLPDHPEQKHPPIYYSMGTIWNLPIPVPKEDALILGNYVYDPETGTRFTRADYIHPWIHPIYRYPVRGELIARGCDACYILKKQGETVEVSIYWINPEDNISALHTTPLSKLHFSPPLPPIPETDRV